MDGRQDFTSTAGRTTGAPPGDAQATVSSQSPNSPLKPPPSSGTGAPASSPSFSALRQQAEQVRSEVGEVLDRGRAGIADSASEARDNPRGA
jgi:hypothetical protein